MDPDNFLSSTPGSHTLEDADRSLSQFLNTTPTHAAEVERDAAAATACHPVFTLEDHFSNASTSSASSSDSDSDADDIHDGATAARKREEGVARLAESLKMILSVTKNEEFRRQAFLLSGVDTLEAFQAKLNLELSKFVQSTDGIKERSVAANLKREGVKNRIRKASKTIKKPRNAHQRSLRLGKALPDSPLALLLQQQLDPPSGSELQQTAGTQLAAWLSSTLNQTDAHTQECEPDRLAAALFSSQNERRSGDELLNPDGEMEEEGAAELSMVSSLLLPALAAAPAPDLCFFSTADEDTDDMDLLGTSSALL